MTVSRVDGEAEFPVPEFSAPRTLKWANEPDASRRNIEPGLWGRRSDLCHTINGSSLLQFFVATEEIGLGVPTMFPAGRYRVRVCVDAENAASITATLTTNFDGTWQGVTVAAR